MKTLKNQRFFGPRKSFGFSREFNFYNGAFAASTLLMIFVIAAELVESFKTFLGNVFGHHWIGKAVLVTIAFLLFGFVYKKDKIFNIKSEKISWYSTLGSLVIILFFYITAFLI